MSVIQKGTKLYSILHNKCPRCQEENFFETGNPYQLKKFDKMPEKCRACGQSFEMETGFYYGAMYVSYGLSVALGIALFLVCYVLLDFSLISYLIINAIVLIGLIPPIFRLSRLTWINLFVKYRKE